MEEIYIEGGSKERRIGGREGWKERRIHREGEIYTEGERREGGERGRGRRGREYNY